MTKSSDTSARQEVLETFEAMAEQQAEEMEEHIRRYFKATGFLACGYCENPAQCHERACWREAHTEMSE